VQFASVSGTLSHSANATLTVTPPANPYVVSVSYYPWYVPAAWVYFRRALNCVTKRASLLSYGAAKLIPTQMREPSLSLPLTTYGDSTPMNLLMPPLNIRVHPVCRRS
jgi:hypothetical protein